MYVCGWKSGSHHRDKQFLANFLDYCTMQCPAVDSHIHYIFQYLFVLTIHTMQMSCSTGFHSKTANKNMGLHSCKLYGYQKNFINSRDKSLLQVKLSNGGKHFIFSNKQEIAGIAHYFVTMQEPLSVSINQLCINMTPPQA